MAANILNSARAVQMSIFVVRVSHSSNEILVEKRTVDEIQSVQRPDRLSGSRIASKSGSY
jgi:hypothetical protein